MKWTNSKNLFVMQHRFKKNKLEHVFVKVYNIKTFEETTQKKLKLLRMLNLLIEMMIFIKFILI